jgi:hypothetical protein
MRAVSHLLILLMAVSLHAGEKSKAKPKGKGKASAVEPAAAASSSLESIGDMIPEGVRNLKVRIPSFDQGRTTSLVVADAMTRQDEKRLFAEGVVLHLYNPEPKDNIRVDMKSATYHLDTKLLSSTERSKVTRADFQIEGDSMTFDTINSHGIMTGRVHLVIHDLSSFSGTKKEPEVPKAIPVPTPPSIVPPTPPAK